MAFAITYTKNKTAIKLTDASGKVVLTDTIEPNSLNFKHTINISDYATVVYMLMIGVNEKTAIKILLAIFTDSKNT